MIRLLLNLYILVVVGDTILSYMPKYRETEWGMKIKKVSDFSLNPIRKVLPPDLKIDISPVILILLVKIIEAIW